MNLMKSNLRTFLCQLCALVVAFFVSFSASAVTYHVDPVNGDDGNSGLFWNQAFKTFQKALTNPLLMAGDDIWVAEGTYKPGALQSDSFIIPLEVRAFGGFPIGGGDLTFGARIPALFEKTILSGDIDDNDTNSPALDPGDIIGDNSYHVVTIIDDDALPPGFVGTEVDGFMITAGNAIHIGIGDNDTGGGGGAFIVDESLPELFDGPFAEGPLFRNCIFQGNRADRTGGAITSLEVGLELRDCQILNNESDGGIIRIDGVWHATTENGGGVSGIAPMIVVNSTFIKNICTGKTTGAAEVYAFGGGLSVLGWHADNPIAVASCFFASNEAQDDPADAGVGGVGGGASISAGSSDEVHVMNCVFVNNVADNNLEAGGGLSIGSGKSVTHCTFYANSAPNGFGGGLVYGSDAPSNCIAWNNTDGATYGEEFLWRQQIYGTGMDRRRCQTPSFPQIDDLTLICLHAGSLASTCDSDGALASTSNHSQFPK